MKLPDIEVHMNLCTRPAILTPKYDITKLGLKKGEPIKVDVFGLYQVRVDEDDIDAYFVAELPDGKCVYAAVDTIQFTDREGDYSESIIHCD